MPKLIGDHRCAGEHLQNLESKPTWEHLFERRLRRIVCLLVRVIESQLWRQRRLQEHVVAPSYLAHGLQRKILLPCSLVFIGLGAGIIGHL